MASARTRSAKYCCRPRSTAACRPGSTASASRARCSQKPPATSSTGGAAPKGAAPPASLLPGDVGLGLELGDQAGDAAAATLDQRGKLLPVGQRHADAVD